MKKDIKLISVILLSMVLGFVFGYVLFGQYDSVP